MCASIRVAFPISLSPILSTFFAAACTTGAAKADVAVAEVCKSNPLSIEAGHASGRDHDTTTRLLVRDFGQHIPRHPNIIIRNMPEAGIIAKTLRVCNTAPRVGIIYKQTTAMWSKFN